MQCHPRQAVRGPCCRTARSKFSVMDVEWAGRRLTHLRREPVHRLGRADRQLGRVVVEVHRGKGQTLRSQGGERDPTRVSPEHDCAPSVSSVPDVSTSLCESHETTGHDLDIRAVGCVRRNDSTLPVRCGTRGRRCTGAGFVMLSCRFLPITFPPVFRLWLWRRGFGYGHKIIGVSGTRSTG